MAGRFDAPVPSSPRIRLPLAYLGLRSRLFGSPFPELDISPEQERKWNLFGRLLETYGWQPDAIGDQFDWLFREDFKTPTNGSVKSMTEPRAAISSSKVELFLRPGGRPGPAL